MSKYLIAHDLGTSGNKATLFSTDGKLIKSQVYNYGTLYTNNNWVEQNPDDWWAAVCETSQHLLEGIDAADVAAISFSGQMMGCVCVDKESKPLRNALIWADMRATEEELEIKSKISQEEFYRTTGHRISPSYGGQKFMWVKKNEPDIYEKTYKMLNAKDFIILKLTDKFVTEPTDASSTCLLDLNTLCWSERLIGIMGIDKEKLPVILKSTDIAGHVTKKAAELTGLKEGTPVVCGGGDGVCAAVGTGCVKEGIAHSCMGTSSWISITAKEPIYDEEMKTFTWAHIVPGYVLPTGTMQSGGGSYAWFTKEFCREEEVSASVSGTGYYDVLEEKLTGTYPGSNGLLFLPYLIGERSPRWNPDAKGGFIGIKMEHRKEDFMRAVMEGVAMNLSIVLSTFRGKGASIDKIVIIGGGAKSSTWRQIMADALNVQILKPNYMEEATSMGAAITAGVGVGVFENFDVIDKFLEIRESHIPKDENVKIYETLVGVFNRAYEALVGVFSSLNDFNRHQS